MAMQNGQITIAGNLTRDPELQYTNGGMALAKFSVAVQERRKTENGWEDGETSFFRCVVFGDHGENVAESLTKGTRVVVVGRMKIGEYTKDDVKHVSPEIVADEVCPSLRWATCTVERTGSRSTPQDSRPVEGHEDF